MEERNRIPGGHIAHGCAGSRSEAPISFDYSEGRSPRQSSDGDRAAAGEDVRRAVALQPPRGCASRSRGAAYGPWVVEQQQMFFRPLVDDHDVFVVTVDHQDVGAVYLGERDGDTWQELIEVAPEHQGWGVGAAALRWVVAQSRKQRRGTLLQVHRVKERARRLHEREGFTACGATATHYLLRRDGTGNAAMACGAGRTLAIAEHGEQGGVERERGTSSMGARGAASRLSLSPGTSQTRCQDSLRHPCHASRSGCTARGSNPRISRRPAR